MATTVPLTYAETRECILWFLNEAKWRDDPQGVKGKAYAAFMAMMYLTSGRVSEVCEFKVREIADRDLRLRSRFQMLNLKRKRKKQIVEIHDDRIIKRVGKYLLNKNVTDDVSKIVVMVEIVTKETKKPVSTRTISIDNELGLARIVEDWLEMNWKVQGNLNPDGYVFVLGSGSKAVRIDRQKVYRAFRRAYKAIDVDYLPHGTHGVRKTSARGIVDANKKANNTDEFTASRKAQDRLGHKKLSNTLIYLPVSEDENTAVSKAHSELLDL